MASRFGAQPAFARKRALRRRLSRRGLAAPAAFGPLWNWLAGDQSAGAVLTANNATEISASATTSVVKLAARLAAGRVPAATPVGASSLVLADGVLQMMKLKKLTIIASVFLSLATVTIGGGTALVRATSGQNPPTKPLPPEAKQAPGPAIPVKSRPADAVNPRVQTMLDIAQRQFEMKVELYTLGEIPVTGVIAAGDQLERLEVRAATSQATRTTARERSLRRFESIATLDQKRFDSGHTSPADHEEIKLRLMQAVLDLETLEEAKAEWPAILRRLKELEEKVQQLEKRLQARSDGAK